MQIKNKKLAPTSQPNIIAKNAIPPPKLTHPPLATVKLAQNQPITKNPKLDQPK